MKKIVSIILLISILTSCSFIMRKVLLGIRKPKVENQKSLTKYLQKNQVDTINAYYLSDSLYLKLITEDTKYFSKYEVYNSKLEKIAPKDTLVNQCYGNIELILKNIENTELWKKDSTINNVCNIEKNYKAINGSLEKEKIFSGNDNYIVFYWAKFMGKYTKSILKIASEIQQQKKPNLKVITINMDKNIEMSDSIKELEYNFN
ncbi:MAG: hypothetical protein R3277_02365 [Brumimicrobium sp.]|nr:hypothetical protein [Brumimicrobium sp.]